jgi:acyl-CoA thioester hydrolase
VPPEWIDYNGHMMDAYYFLAFTEATEAFLDHVGLGAAYRARTGSGIYTAESHLCFLSGVVGGAVLAYQTQLLGHDAKRLHVFHRMSESGTLVATCELMFLHVSGERVSPMPPEAVAVVDALAVSHAALPRPERAGRRVAMPVLRVLRGFTFTVEVGLSSTDYPGDCDGRIGYLSSWRITLADRSQLTASDTATSRSSRGSLPAAAT